MDQASGNESRPSLIIIEPSPIYLKYIESCIIPLNLFTIYAVDSINKAKVLIDRYNSEIIIYDLILLNEADISYLSEINTTRLGLPYKIAISALHGDEYIRSAYTIGSDYFLRKGFTSFELGGILQNIMKQIDYRKRILEQEHHYRTLFEQAADPNLLIRLNDYKILSANKAAIKLYGFSENKVASYFLNDISEDMDKIKRLINSRAKSLGGIKQIDLSHRQIPVIANISYLQENEEEVALISIKDIRPLLTEVGTDINFYTHGLKPNEEQLSLETKAFLLGEANERRRLQREIHDHVGQLLVSLKLQMEDNLIRAEDESLKADLRQSRNDLMTAIKTLRNITAKIDKDLLPNNDLDFALDTLIEKLTRKHQLKIEKIGSFIFKNLPILIQSHLYRIFEETCTNALKHSTEQKLKIELNDSGTGSVNIVMTSYGIHDANATINLAGGLRFMQHRASMIGGHIEFYAGANDQFVINLTLPLPDKLS